LKWLQICEFLIEIICILFLNTTLFYNFILPVNKYLAERRKARKFLGYFVWKITILRQKILFFLIAEGGAKILGISCEKLRFYAKKIIFFPILGGGASAGCAPLWIRPWGVWLITKNRIAYEPFIMNISNSNITSFFRFVNERAIYRWYNLISTCTGACDWLSRRKCTCWWIIVCSNLAA
jgi:hypothetical protein